MTDIELPAGTTSRVLTTIGRLNIGGVETRLLRFLKEIRHRELPVELGIFVVSGQRGHLDEEFIKLGAKLYYADPGYRGLAALYGVCRSFRPHVLHVRAQLASGFYSAAGLLAGVSPRISLLSTVGRGRRGAFGRTSDFVYALFLRTLSTRVVGVCDASRQDTLVPSHKWLTIYDGVDPAPKDLSRPDGYEPGRLNIVVLGRGDPVKNVPRALRVAAALKRSGELPLLHLVGPRTPEQLAETANAISDLQIADCVRLHGSTLQPLSYLTAADVMLLPSFREGLPGVVLEALSCGLPVVASDLAGVKEIAARSEGVTPVSLDCTDEVWADALVRARRFDRARIRESFEKGPFLFERSFEASIDLWFPNGRPSVRH